jgi:hypothetical protein
VACTSYLTLTCSILTWQYVRLLIILWHQSPLYLIIDISTREYTFMHQWRVFRSRHMLRKIEFTSHHIGFFRSRSHHQVHLKDFKLYTLLLFGIPLPTLERHPDWGIFIGNCFAKRKTCLIHGANWVFLMFFAIKSGTESIWRIHLTCLIIMWRKWQVLNVHFGTRNLLWKDTFAWLNQLSTTFVQSTDRF